MNHVLSAVFWITVFLLFFTWLLYPVLLRLIRFIRRRTQQEKLDYTYSPRVSVIIAAHNEEKNIANRIENLTGLNYPDSLIEVIVASDGSTDGTNEIVTEISRKNDKICLLPFEQQRGRAHVHNESVKRAKGDIVVFTDAETRFEPDFLRILMPHFSDPKVGCVSGRIYYKNVNQSSITKSAGIYWKYEELIRTLESDLGILAFGTGAGLATRKEAYVPTRPTLETDCALPLAAKLKGYRVKYEPRAKAYDYVESDERSAHIARIRKTSRAFEDTIGKLLRVNPVKNPMLFGSVFFHRTSRHLTPFYMIIILVANMFLVPAGRIYYAILACQLLFYALALAGRVLEKTHKRVLLFSIPYNFVLINVSRFTAVLQSILGTETRTWVPGNGGSEIR